MIYWEESGEWLETMAQWVGFKRGRASDLPIHVCQNRELPEHASEDTELHGRTWNCVSCLSLLVSRASLDAGATPVLCGKREVEVPYLAMLQVMILNECMRQLQTKF